MIVGVPIPVRKGRKVVAFAIVSPEDAERIGGFTWSMSDRGYAQTWLTNGERGTSTSMHRMVAGIEPGDPRIVHHDNEIQLDNRRENLHVLGQREHMRHHKGTDSFERQFFRLAKAVAVVARLEHSAARHDLAGYRHRGCRCEICKEAASVYMRGLKGREPREHGTASAYKNYGCRCDPCKAAGSEDNRLQRQRRAERERTAA